MDALVAVVVCLFAGVALRFVRAFPGEAAVAVLNAFAIHVALPAVILRQIPSLDTSGVGVVDLLIPALVPWALLAVSAGLVWVVGRRLGWSREVTLALMMVVPLGNTAFIGLPLVSALAGPDALPYAILYDQLGSFTALVLYGTVVTAAARSPDGRGPGPEDRPAPEPATPALRRILTFPPFVALVVAVALLVGGVSLPPMVAGALDKIGASLVPTTLVAVGLGWRFTLPEAERGPFALALVLKLGVLPALAWGLLAWLAPPAPVMQATLLEAGMGPMITAGALAIQAGLAPRLVAAVVGWGTFASLVTVPLWSLVS